MDTVKIAAQVVKYVVLPPLVPFLIPIVLSALAWFVNQLQSRSECERTVKKNDASIRRPDWKTSQSSIESPENWSHPNNSKQNYSPEWLISQNSHPGSMIDMEFPTSKTFIASCPDDDPGGISGSSSSSEANKENNSPGRLSRRQRKNRVRKEDSSPMKKKVRKDLKKHCVLKQYVNLNMSDIDVFFFMRNYMLSPKDMMTLGYPVESKLYPGRAMIFKASPKDLDANAKEFIPRDESVRSSLLVQNSEQNNKSHGSKDKKNERLGSEEKKCMRCGKKFFLSSDGEYITHEHCIYHWGKLLSPPLGGCDGIYSCCKARAETKGCATGKLHVWSGVEPGSNGPLEGFVRTRQRKIPPLDGNHGVYALDCEMCFTNNGLELTKISVVGLDGRPVYETFVRPENSIIDYNTRFSGISAKDMSRGNKIKTLKDVQNDLMGFITADTILVGHGLENDLRALRMVHTSVVDTTMLFPHALGLPFKRSLKSLAHCYLRKDIQVDTHNSYEDACSCLELVLWKLRKDLARCNDKLL